MSKCRTGNDLQGECKKHIPARIKLAVDNRALTPRISHRGQLGHGDIGQIRRWQREKITKRIPLWALSAPTPPRPPSSPLVPLSSMNCARYAPPPATHTVASRDRHISHAFRFPHLPPLSCISVLCGDRSTAPMSCNQAGRPINHEPTGAGPFNGRETAAFRT